MQELQERKIFSGLNTDDTDIKIPNGDYRYALCIDTADISSANVGSVVNIAGTTKVSIVLPAGENRVIGTFEYFDFNCTIYCVWNSNGDHGIYIYKFETDTIELIMQWSGFNFHKDSLINHANLVAGKLFYWAEESNPPRKINIEKANETGKLRELDIYWGINICQGETYTFDILLNGVSQFTWNYTALNTISPADAFGLSHAFVQALPVGALALAEFEACGAAVHVHMKNTGVYTMNITRSGSADPREFSIAVAHNFYPLPYKEDFIDRLKYPFHCNPTAVYKIDNTKRTNLVQNKVFQFACQYVYDDNEKSAISPISPIPEFGSECQQLFQQSHYNYIEIDFTEDRLNDLSVRSLIKRVNLFFREHNSGKFKLITSLQPYQFGWTENKFRFYNDGVYAGIPDSEANKLFDSVPITSGAQEYIGNRIMDSNIVEGYDTVCIDTELDVTYKQNSAKLFNIKGDLMITSNWDFNVSQPGFPLYKVPQTFIGANPGYDPASPIAYGGMLQDKLSNPPTTETPFITNNSNKGATSRAVNIGQICPLGGFVIYLAGTDYYSVSKQNPQGIPADTYGVLNEKPPGTVIGLSYNSPFKSDWEISGVPPGVYALRVASHKTTNSDLINPSRKYQRTSTNIYTESSSYIPSSGVLFTGKTEAIIEVLASGIINVRDPDSYAILNTINPGNSAGTIHIQDTSMAGHHTATQPADAHCMTTYVIDGAGAAAPATTQDMMDMERVTRARVTIREENDSNHSDYYQYVSRTDHNGYMFSCFYLHWNSLPTNGNVFLEQIESGITVADVANGLPQYIRGGGLVWNPNPWYPTQQNKFPDSSAPGTEGMYFFSTDLLSTTGRTFVDGIAVDSTGSPLNGLTIGMTYHGFTDTDSNGRYSLSFYAYPGGNNGLLIASASQLCPLSASPIPQTFTLGIPVPYDNVNHFIAQQLLVFVTQPFALGAFKRGFDGQLGIVYYDRGNRSTTVNTNEKLNLHINFYTEPDQTTGQIFNVGEPEVAWAIKNIPPDWATHWQWVRTKNLQISNYIQFIANEVNYTDELDSTAPTTTYALGQYVMIDINNLALYVEQNPNSQLAYTWVAGDRIRFIASAQNNVFTNYFDYEIVKEDQGFIFILKDLAFPEQQEGLLFEIYTPRLETNEKLFFEMGECFEVGDLGGIKYHKGDTQDQDPNNPFGVPAQGVFKSGDVWYRKRRMPMVQGLAVVNKVNVIDDKSISDFYKSDDQSIGRINIQNDDIGQVNREKTIRFSEVYIEETKVNGLSSVLSGNAETIKKGDGAVYKLQRAGAVLLAIQRKQVNSVYVNEIIYIDSLGNESLTVSDKVIGNIRPLQGNYGTTHAESVVEYEGVVYFFDVLGASVIRYHNDGLSPINYKIESYLSNKSYEISRFNNKDVQVFGGYDPFGGHYLMTFRDSDYINPVKKFTEQTIVFSEDENRWKSFMPYLPESFSFAGMEFIAFKSGELWRFSGNPLYNNFFGVQYTSKVTIVGNQNYGKINQFIGIGEETNTVWSCPSLKTPPRAQYPNGMESRLIKSKFRPVMGVQYAAIMKDMNTPNRSSVQDALLNGRDMTGHVLVIELENDSTEFVKLDAINIRYVPQEYSKK